MTVILQHVLIQLREELCVVDHLIFPQNIRKPPTATNIRKKCSIQIKIKFQDKRMVASTVSYTNNMQEKKDKLNHQKKILKDLTGT